MSESEFRIIPAPRLAPHLADAEARREYVSFADERLALALRFIPSVRKEFITAKLYERAARYPIRVRPTNDPEILARAEAGRALMQSRLASRAAERANLNVSIELRLPPNDNRTLRERVRTDSARVEDAGANGTEGPCLGSGSVRVGPS